MQTYSSGAELQASITVFLVDDHDVVRRGLTSLLDPEPDIHVVGEAATAAEARARIPAVRPLVAVLDVRLPDDTGIAVCRDVRSQLPELRCLMLTSFADDEALIDAVIAGASGYVLKQIRGNDLVDAIRTLASGKSLLDTSSTASVLERLRRSADARANDPLSTLTARETQLLHLIGEGLTNRQIGERLHLSEKTIKNQVSTLLSKLRMDRRAQVAALAARLESGSSDKAL